MAVGLWSGLWRQGDYFGNCAALPPRQAAKNCCLSHHKSSKFSTRPSSLCERRSKAEIRLGLPEEYSDILLPAILADFSQEQPGKAHQALSSLDQRPSRADEPNHQGRHDQDLPLR